MFYKLKLIDAADGRIELNDDDGKKRLTDVKFCLKQDTNLASERASDLRCLIDISGVIDDEEVQTQTRLMLEWSQETRDLKKVYKHLTLEVWNGNDDLARRYELDNVYCVDYSEFFGGEGDNKGKFELKLTQKKGNIGSIKFASN